ncbi:MAG: hypothetical protein V4819_16365 [Verrucomicrobiota bacterium]
MNIRLVGMISATGPHLSRRGNKRPFKSFFTAPNCISILYFDEHPEDFIDVHRLVLLAHVLDSQLIVLEPRAVEFEVALLPAPWSGPFCQSY